ncbi:MAG: Arm DNA-binding domain-containing protein [Rhizomicrobium sp.]
MTHLATKPGLYADGGGLYLKSTEGGASWVLRYMLNGRPRYMGLGPLALYGLQEARARPGCPPAPASGNRPGRSSA